LRRDQLQLSQDVVDIDFFHISGGLPLIFPDGITEFLIKSPEVIWVLILILDGYGSLGILHHIVDILDLLLGLLLLIKHTNCIRAQVSPMWLSNAAVLSSSTLLPLSSLRRSLLGALLGM
jgi:hypothetical protein